MMKIIQTKKFSVFEINESNNNKNNNNCVIYYSEDCLYHSITNHLESSNRIESILNELQKNYDESYFRICRSITNEEILLYHTEEYLERLIHLFNKSENEHSKVPIDRDTIIMPYTRNAVYSAAGSLLSAIDDLMLPSNHPNHIRTAFCCVRPPGHHAERNRAMGFCFLSNAAIAAKYAQSRYNFTKVAVLDFDVHHGNGTEEGFFHDPTLFYGSTHEFGGYPNTGYEPKLRPITLSELLEDFNLTQENYLQNSILHPNNINKYLSVMVASENSELQDNQIKPYHRIVNRQLNTGNNSLIEFRRKWRDIVYEVIKFKPNLIIISAGFDAHKLDPIGNCHLNENDFEWATDLVKQASNYLSSLPLHGNVPILSILEGGYNLKALSSSTLSHIQSLFKF